MVAVQHQHVAAQLGAFPLLPGMGTNAGFGTPMMTPQPGGSFVPGAQGMAAQTYAPQGGMMVPMQFGGQQMMMAMAPNYFPAQGTPSNYFGEMQGFGGGFGDQQFATQQQGGFGGQQTQPQMGRGFFPWGLCSAPTPQSSVLGRGGGTRREGLDC